MNKKLVPETKRFKEGITLKKEGFRKDFTAFLEIPKEVAESINEIFKENIAFYRGIKDNIRLISERANYHPKKVSQALTVVRFFSESLEKEENLDDLLSDLVFMEYISEDEVKKVKEKIEIISDTFKKWRINEDVKDVEAWGAPELSGFSTSADLRLHPKKLFDIFENAEEYEPQAENLIPMALMEINIKKLSGEESLSFQFTVEQVRMLKNSLMALEKEMLLLDKIAKKYTNREK